MIFIILLGQTVGLQRQIGALGLAHGLGSLVIEYFYLGQLNLAFLVVPLLKLNPGYLAAVPLKTLPLLQRKVGPYVKSSLQPCIHCLVGIISLHTHSPLA